MGIELLNEYFVPVIIVLCLCVGYVIKHWLKDVDNKIIPTVCAVLGALLAVWINWGAITPEVIAGGVVSGLASTGLHQAFKQYLGNSEQ